MTHRLRGEAIEEDNVRRAIELTLTRYCPVFAMLSPAVDVLVRYEISDPDGTPTAMGEVPIEPSAT
jgi:uncharacterized OsmC-like protein